MVLIDEVFSRARSYALLDVAEAMLMGKPVIATNYSGNLDFMNADNSLLVNIHGLVRVGDDAQSNYFADGQWAGPDLKRAQAETATLLSVEARTTRLRDQLSISAVSSTTPLCSGR